MNFRYSARGLSGGERALQRILEIFPGAVSWTCLGGITFLSFTRPVAAAVLIIVFNLYWLFRLFYMTVFLVASYVRLHSEKDTDWIKEVRALGEGRTGEISGRRRRREAERLIAGGASVPSGEDVRHLVIIPVARESGAVIEPGVRSLSRQTFSPKKTLVVLAVEERAAAAVKEDAARLAEKFKGYFMDFLVVLHPDGLPGEARVKGANAAYAAKAAAGYLTEKGVDFDGVVVSCFDADTVVNEQYLACLTYHFMACPDRTRTSFQPIPVYHNNIWEAPGFARVLETGSSFFLLIESTDPEKLVTFSSHSMSFRALVDVGYWPADMVSDDSAIFWKCFIHFDGNYRVVPMYVTVSMDVVGGKNWVSTAVNVYKQKQRWAWGVENFPIVVRAFLKAGKIPLKARFRLLVKLLESHGAGARGAFLLTFVGWLPAIFASQQFSRAVLYYSSQRISGAIFNLSMLSFMVTLILSQLLLPKKKVKHAALRRLVFACEWLLIPLIMTFFGALPALHTQTRLMMGKYLGFWVAEKHRK